MQIVETSASFTRPANTTAYTSGDLMANHATAGSVVPLTFAIPYGRSLRINRVFVSKTTATVTAAKYRIHLYKDSPTVTNGDNDAWLSTASGYFGSVDVDGSVSTFSGSASANATVTTPMYIYANKNRKIYGLVEARDAYTPGSAEVFTITLLGEAYV